MEYTRSFHIADIGKHPYYLKDIVAVERSEITYIQTFEYILFMAQQRFKTIIETQYATTAFFADQSHLLQRPIHTITQLIIGRRSGYMRHVAA